MLYKVIVSELLKPTIRRLGTVATTYMISVGFPEHIVLQFVATTGALVLFAIELAMSSKERKK